jgi:hypothetical protein
MCLADGPALGGLAALSDDAPRERVRFGPDLEPIVRLLEETPRVECVRVFVAELRRVAVSAVSSGRFLCGHSQGAFPS